MNNKNICIFLSMLLATQVFAETGVGESEAVTLTSLPPFKKHRLILSRSISHFNIRTLPSVPLCIISSLSTNLT